MNTFPSPEDSSPAPIRLDRFQSEAIECIRANRSVLVSAPTGAGKTLIAEYAVDESFRAGRRVIYTAPIKALSNQKYRDFSLKYGTANVGILTGDVTINREAPLLLMTTEILRNTIFEDAASLSDVSWVIFDEIHYIDDVERGTVWEEALLFCPPQVRVVGLSATVPNVEELGRWIQTVHGMPVSVIVETNRPVPLRHQFQCNNRVHENLEELKKRCYQGSLRKAPAHHFQPNRLEPLVSHLHESKGFPCIYFVFSRRRTELIAREFAPLMLTPEEESRAILETYDDLCRRFGLEAEKTAAELRELVAHSVAYHHAGMLPSLKEVVERLFTARRLRLICTTETFALGINMPVRSVIFDELRKFYGTHFGNLRTRDYYQMAGRAGRRGLDRYGTVYARVNPRWISHREIEKIVYGRPEPVESRFSSSYAVLISLYAKYGDRLIDVYPRTFHCYLAGPGDQRKAVGLIERKISLLKQLEYLGRGEILLKGRIASRLYGYELILTELLQSGLLGGLSEIELLALIAAVVFEPRPNDAKPALEPKIKWLRNQVRDVGWMIHRRERQFGVPVSRKPAFHLSPYIMRWARGADFTELTSGPDPLDEGTLVRYFRMVIQLCRQLISTPEVDPGIAQKLSAGIRLVNRDEIDAEKELREGLGRQQQDGAGQNGQTA